MGRKTLKRKLQPSTTKCFNVQPREKRWWFKFIREAKREKNQPPPPNPAKNTSHSTIDRFEYKVIWDAADFSLSVCQSLTACEKANWNFLVGTVQAALTTHNNDEVLPPSTLPKNETFSIYINTTANTHHLIFDDPKSGRTTMPFDFTCYQVDFGPNSFSPDHLQALEDFIINRTKLKIVVGDYNPGTGQLALQIYFLQPILSQLSFGSQALNAFKGRRLENIKRLMSLYHGYAYPDLPMGNSRPVQDINRLFEVVRDYHKKEPKLEGVETQHPALIPLLRPYQKQAILWMLEKENYDPKFSLKQAPEMHPLWTEVKGQDGKPFYYNHYGGLISLDQYKLADPIPGGILADEMGLGKTVEVLALVLLHPRIPPGGQQTLSHRNQEEALPEPIPEEMSLCKSNHEETAAAEPTFAQPTDGVAEKAAIPDVKGPSEAKFACICGVKNAIWKSAVQCDKCKYWQHAVCVNFEPGQLTAGQKYYCPHCHILQPLVKSGATLIISPNSICHQWVDEINCHIRGSGLRLLVYHGVKHHRFLQPSSLASMDLVITTYQVLSTEINYVDLPHYNSKKGRKLRHAKRYNVTPSPLVAVEWWRVCLDEAQMVGCTTSKTAEMAQRLSTINRWCVTGTPIQQRINDLYGLFLFLGVDPYWVKDWWNRLLMEPYMHGDPQPLNQALSKILWRNAKEDVLDQINIPEQTEEIHWLKFTAVEEHFYQCKHDECTSKLMETLRHLPYSNHTKCSQIYAVEKVLSPLLKLRQACCHPQAIRGEFLTFAKTTLTMKELLKSLINKAKKESEEVFRIIVCGLNGMAGVHTLKSQYGEAVEKYREVLRLVEEHKSDLKTDSLQRLHTLHSLALVLEKCKENQQMIQPTLRDHSLLQEAEEIRQSYMAKSVTVVTAAEEVLQPIQRKIKELRRKLRTNSNWFMDLLHWATDLNLDEEVVQKVKDELQEKNTNEMVVNIGNRFGNMMGMQYVLATQLLEMEETRENLVQDLQQLCSQDRGSVVQHAIECHLRPFPGITTDMCEICKIDELFNIYETKLFYMAVRRVAEVAIDGPENEGPAVAQEWRPRGNWAPSQLENVLRVVLNFGKQNGADPITTDTGGLYMDILEAMKKEFKAMRGVWMSVRDHVGCLDELEMATTRLRMRLPNEPVNPTLSQANIIEQGELDQTMLRHESDKRLAEIDLKIKLGQLLYLKNLAKAQTQFEGGVNPEPCPICEGNLGSEWTVMQCGHCYCNHCMATLVQEYRGCVGRRAFLKCPLCRHTTPTGEISHVTTNPDAHLNEEDRSWKVKGSYSTKIEAIVRTIMKIRSKDPTAKSIVFSTWQDVLSLLSKAMYDNEIFHRFIPGTGFRHYQSYMMDFKHKDRVNVLLLPLNCGSRGLNIIEATHVLLMEPIINPATELQAIGRIHRIGQTKKTYVHQFIVKKTIEERMRTVLQATHSRARLDETQSEAAMLTVGDLKALFSSNTT